MLELGHQSSPVLELELMTLLILRSLDLEHHHQLFGITS